MKEDKSGQAETAYDAGAVGIVQVARRPGAACGRFPVANRLCDTYGDKIEIITVGEPVTPSETHILAEQDRLQFQ